MLRNEARERDIMAGDNPELMRIDSELGEMERRGESPVGVGFTPQGTYPTGDDALMHVRATKKTAARLLLRCPEVLRRTCSRAACTKAYRRTPQ